MIDDEKKEVRHQTFWDAPKIKLKGDPSIKHAKWNPYEKKEIELDYD